MTERKVIQAERERGTERKQELYYRGRVIEL